MMDGRYLGRDDAPISVETWGLLDTVMVEAAKGILSGRRLLGISGPYGLGLKAIPMSDAKGRKGFITSECLPGPPAPGYVLPGEEGYRGIRAGSHRL